MRVNFICNDIGRLDPLAGQQNVMGYFSFQNVTFQISLLLNVVCFPFQTNSFYCSFIIYFRLFDIRFNTFQWLHLSTVSRIVSH